MATSKKPTAQNGASDRQSRTKAEAAKADAVVQAPDAPEADRIEPAPKPDWALNGRERRARERAAQGLPPKRRRWPWIVLALLLIGGGAYWYTNSYSADAVANREDEAATAQAAAETAPVMQLIGSEIHTIRPTTLRETIKVTGSLSPRRQLHLSAEVGGRVETVSGRPGDAVGEGDTLVQINIDTLESQLEQQRATAEATRAQLRLAETKLDRIESLNERGLNSASDLEAGRANVAQLAASLNALETQVRTAELSLAHATVTAPFAGRIADRSVDPGQVVGTGTSLMTLVDLSSLEFEATAPITYAPELKLGQLVEVEIEGLTRYSFAGAVDRINPVAATGSRMLPIYVAIENPDDLLRGGMFASGQLVLSTKEDALGVPVAAVQRDAEGEYVLKIEGDHVVRQPVSVARMWEGGRISEIASGLSVGDMIVAVTMAELRPGAKIEILEGFQP